MRPRSIHGISTEFLAGKPLFRDVVRDFLAFIGDDTLVIHNAQFDIMFLNHELGLVGEKALSFDRVVDTLAIARRRHPAGPNSLDALCKRYAIDNSQRTKHGAWSTACCSRRFTSSCSANGKRRSACRIWAAMKAPSAGVEREVWRNRAAEPLPSRISEADVDVHRAFIDKLATRRYG